MIGTAWLALVYLLRTAVLLYCCTAPCGPLPRPWSTPHAHTRHTTASQVSFFNLKKLFSNEELVEPQLQLEMELEEDTSW